MSLIKYKIGELIEQVDIRNSDNIYGSDSAIGVNIDKIILPMRGDSSEKDLSTFKLVPPNHFAYNPRGSRKLGLGFNDSNKTYIITFNDNVFKVKESAQKLILNSYLFMYLSRKEWDRKAEFISWGSSTEVFDWKEFCELDIELPDLPTQQKYVDIYNGMIANQKSYESGLEDLKLVCDGYIEDLRRKMPLTGIGHYISERREKNSNGEFKKVLGISVDGFIDPKQDTGDVHNYWIFKKNDFVYSPPRINVGSIGLYKGNEPALCSPIYVVFNVLDENVLYPEYLDMWLHRNEFFRSTDYYAIGSVRNNFSFDLMSEVKIPIPDINVQKSISNIYKILLERKRISDQLKEQIKNICPILIKGSIEEAKRSN